MKILETLGVDNLALRGRGEEFNSSSRLFKSKDDALAAVAEGDYQPVAGVANVVIIMGYGIALYSFELNDFVLIEDFATIDNQASKFIELDGANDFVQFTSRTSGSENALDWSKSWSIGFTFVGVESSSDNKWMAMLSSGENHITLRRGGTNWGMYVTSNNNGYQHGANTWFAPSSTSRVLFTYDHTTYRLKYYLGEQSTGTYSMRANLLVNSTVRSGNNPDGNLYIGKGAGSGTFGIIHMDAGINNLIVSDQVLVTTQLDEYFQTGDDFTTHEYYPDLTSYCRLGEDTFPNVSDEKGNMTGGTLENGTAEDFKDVPTS